MNITDILLLKANVNNIFIYPLYALVPQNFLIIAALFFSCIIVVVIIGILFYLFRKSRLNQRKESFQKKFNEFISEIAICESEEELNGVLLQPAYQKILHQYQQSRIDRNFMIGELAETCKKFSGATMDNIHWLFQRTHLEEELLHNLNSKRWYIKAKAVQQLAYLQQKNQLPKIFRLANNNNDLVRMEAQVATVKLIGFEGLRFLNVIGYPVSEWQQLRLIHELSGHTIEKFDNITNWLQSKNDSVVEFALRLVENNQRYEFYNTVEQCLLHSSISVCRRAVATLGKISNEKTAGSLLNYYPNADPSIQLSILKILQTVGSENEIPFLLSRLNHPDDAFKLETAKSISQISDTGIERIEALVDVTKEPWKIILQQIKTGNTV
jgi:hypothetical protein